MAYRVYEVIRDTPAFAECLTLIKDRTCAPEVEQALGIVTFCLDLEICYKGDSLFLIIGASSVNDLETYERNDLIEVTDMSELVGVTFVPGIGTGNLQRLVRNEALLN